MPLQHVEEEEVESVVLCKLAASLQEEVPCEFQRHSRTLLRKTLPQREKGWKCQVQERWCVSYLVDCNLFSHHLDARVALATCTVVIELAEIPYEILRDR